MANRETMMGDQTATLSASQRRAERRQYLRLDKEPRERKRFLRTPEGRAAWEREHVPARLLARCVAQQSSCRAKFQRELDLAFSVFCEKDKERCREVAALARTRRDDGPAPGDIYAMVSFDWDAGELVEQKTMIWLLTRCETHDCLMIWYGVQVVSDQSVEDRPSLSVNASPFGKLCLLRQEVALESVDLEEASRRFGWLNPETLRWVLRRVNKRR